MKKILVLGAVALLLSGGLALVSCGVKCPDGGDCTINISSEAYKDCSDTCIIKQAQTGNPRNLSCDC
jgi:hypothetical protein